ncbi:MAG: type II toxin-antitoxin system PemK/MazF family toxin [Anaerolineales bacterium]|nr:type II toxin-antitoxin system PemK/MazF family toxin [Anaerolineales bacterium]
MVIQQGDIYWVELEQPAGSEPGYRHPHIVIQNNVYNQSRINTVVLCTLSSNINRAKIPGNILLEEGEAGLSKASVVLVSQIVTVEKACLDEYVGTVSRSQMQQILNGIDLVLQPRELE